nr:leucine-rich repeat domain-containing protein [uncultured Ruminococcus sp.]
MAELIVHNPPRAALKASGYIGSPEGDIELTENDKTYNVSSFASATVKIPEEEKTVTPSAVKQEITPDNGLLSKVTVLPAPLEERTVTPTIVQQTITPEAPAIGLSKVTVGAALPPPILVSKQITENGTYTAADDNADGYSEVTVAVPREITKLVDGTITEYVDDEVTAIAQNTFYKKTALTTCIVPNVRTIGDAAFDGCVSLSNVDFSSVRSIDQYAFRSANILAVNFPNLIEVGTRGFMNSTGLSSWNLPLLETIGSYAFAFINPANKVIDLPNCTSIGEGAFFAVVKLNVILRKRATLAFYGNAKIYAYQEDIDNYYSTATNWSALYAHGQIYPIEGSEYE